MPVKSAIRRGMCNQGLWRAGMPPSTCVFRTLATVKKIWDHVAGCVIVKEAGGIITDASGMLINESGWQQPYTASASSSYCGHLGKWTSSHLTSVTKCIPIKGGPNPTSLHPGISSANPTFSLSCSFTAGDSLMSIASSAPCAGAELDFGKGRWLDLDRGIVTSTPTVHAALLRAIKELAEEPRQ